MFDGDKNMSVKCIVAHIFFDRLLIWAFLLLIICRCLQDADTDENQGSLGFEEFCSFYKMISTRRDLYLIMISYSSHKEVMDLHDLARFMENEQKVKQKMFKPVFHVSERSPQCTLAVLTYRNNTSLKQFLTGYKLGCKLSPTFR